MEEAINLHELFQLLRKRIKLIILTTFSATAIAGLVSFYVLTPIYQASTQILVTQSRPANQLINMSELQTNLQLINSYNVIMKSPAILDLVKEELDIVKPIEQLESQIIVANEKDSQVISLTVQDPNPKMAVDIANTTVRIFQKEIVNLMNIDNVSILSKAVLKDQSIPVKPRKLLNMVIASILGLMIGVGLAFLLEYLDNTVKNEQDIEQYLNLTVLGFVSTIKFDRGNKNKAVFKEMRSGSVGT